MGVLKRNSGVAWFVGRTGTRPAAILGSLLAVIALILTFGCQQKTALKPSAPAPEKTEVAVAARPEMGAPTELTNDHCVLCHPVQPQTIETHGAKHKTEVGCLDCHQEHPPQGTKAVPECDLCHSGESHYELEQCSSCHADTHAPLDLKLEGEITDACLTCHQQQGDEVKAHPSAHTDLACNECHAAHRKIPDCTQCHEKHTEDMNFEACVSCHPVHMPLVIAYNQDTPSHYCGACHEEALSLLEKNATKHHDLTCAYCHRDKHKVIPPCFACHGTPHPKAILDKYPECGQCHGIAHDLQG